MHNFPFYKRPFVHRSRATSPIGHGQYLACESMACSGAILIAVALINAARTQTIYIFSPLKYEGLASLVSWKGAFEILVFVLFWDLVLRVLILLGVEFVQYGFCSGQKREAKGARKFSFKKCFFSI